MEMEQDDAPKGGLVISDVSEFVANLSSSAAEVYTTRPTPAARAASVEVADSAAATAAAGEPAKEDTEMEGAIVEDEAEDYRARTRAESEEAEEQDVAMKEATTEEHSTTTVCYHGLNWLAGNCKREVLNSCSQY